MKITLSIIAAIIFLIITYQVGRILYFSKKGQSLAENTKPFSVHPNSASKAVLILGDSLAVGVGSSDPSKSIAGLMGKDHPDWDITNISVSGAKVVDGLTQINTVSSKKYDLIFIQIGGNDVVRFTGNKKLFRHYEALLKIATAMSNRVVATNSGSVGFAPIFQFPLSFIYTARSKNLYRHFESISKSADVPYVNLYVSWKDDFFKNDISKYYAVDNFHVTDAAYAVWYEKIRPFLR